MTSALRSIMSNVEVLIIGGGIGGLALAHGLRNHNISFHVYERDRTELYRALGYRIRIGGPAIEGLEYLLDPETMTKFNLSCADMRMKGIPEFDAASARIEEPKVDLPTVSAATEAALRGKARCIDRAAMREVLLKGLDPDTVSYDKTFVRYEETTDGVTAHFDDGTSASGRLLVGADGRGSRLREQLIPELRVLDTGTHCVYGKTYITPELLEVLEHATMERMSFVKDRSREEILAMALEPITFSSGEEREAEGLSKPKDYLFWVLSGTSRTLGFTDAAGQHLSLEESEQLALKISEHWHPSLRIIIERQAKGETAAFGVGTVSKDFGQMSWEPDGRVTLIGDAVHPMAATGSGAVVAIVDARMLCSGLVAKKGGSDYREVIESYEKAMRALAGEAIPGSWIAVSSLAGMTKANEIHLGEMAMKIRARNVANMSKQP